MQNGQKKTTIAISTFINAEHYLGGGKPICSRVDGVVIDKKYPTPAEVYAKRTDSKLVVDIPAVMEVKDEEGNITIESVDAIMKETNWYADAVSDEI